MLMAEELLLIRFVDGQGYFNGNADTDYDLIVCGGLLAELFLMGRLRLDDDSLAVLDNSPTGELFLESTLERLGHGIRFEKDDDMWLAAIVEKVALGRQVFDHLLERGLLITEEKRRLGIFSSTIYRVQDPAVLQPYRDRERQIMIGGQVPDARMATLLFMAGILGDADRPKYSRKENKNFERRWEALFGDYWGWMPTDNPAPIAGLDLAARKAIGAMVISLGTIEAAGYSVDYTAYD